METIMLIVFLIVGLLSSFSLIFFSNEFKVFDSVEKNIKKNQLKKEEFFRRIKHNSTRIKHQYT